MWNERVGPRTGSAGKGVEADAESTALTTKNSFRPFSFSFARAGCQNADVKSALHIADKMRVMPSRERERVVTRPMSTAKAS
jgi:hypothetical protein